MAIIEFPSEEFFSGVGTYEVHSVVRKLRAVESGEETTDDDSDKRRSSRGASRQLRVLLLTHPQCLPPVDAAGPAEDGVPWQAEQDVLWGLRCLGHEARALGVLDDLVVLDDAVATFKPHIVFNMLEEFDGVAQFDQNVVGYLECRGIRYTGVGPKGLLLSRDKALAKTIVEAAGVRTPSGLRVVRGRAVTDAATKLLPAIVKSTTEDASLGISEASVVRTKEALCKRVAFVHEQLRTDALVESFIEGIDVYVALTGNLRAEIFPARALRFPEVGPRIATRRAKWNEAYRKKHGLLSGPLGEIAKPVEKELVRFSRDAYEALAMNGYARIDFRLDRTGQLWFLEANANPHLGRREDFATAAQQAGITYPALLARILSLGMKWKPQFA